MSVSPSLATSVPSSAKRNASNRLAVGNRPALERLERREVPAAKMTFSAAQQFVMQLYSDLLERTPGASEVGYWTGTITDGASREQVIQGIANSHEYAAERISSFYRTYLERNPGDSELTWWVGAFQRSAGRDVEAAFLRTDEFFNKHGGTDSGWVSGVYEEVLGRAPDTNGNTFWTKTLNRGTPRDVVVNALLNSREAREKAVREVYQTYLRREPDPVGLNYSVNSLTRGATVSQIITGLASSKEYYNAQYTTFDSFAPMKFLPRLPDDPLPGNTGGPKPTGPTGGDGSGTTDGGTTGGTPVTKPLPRNPLPSSGPGRTPGTSGPQSRDVNVSNQGGGVDNVEMHLAVNPTNPSNIVIFTTSQDNVATNVDLYYTFDGGNTWTLNRLGPATDGIATNFRFDPVVTFDAGGTVHLAYGISTSLGAGNGTSYVIAGRSTDGGQTVQTTIVAQDNEANTFNDKWLITTGPAPGNPSILAVYVAWIRFGANNAPGHIVISGSLDGGVTYSPFRIVSDVVSNQFASPGVGPNGEIYVSFVGATNAIQLDVSTTFNGTAASFNFGTDRVVRPLNNPNFTVFPPSQPNRGISSIPILAVDRSSGPNSGTVYIVYPDLVLGTNPNDFDIFLLTSRDGGNTFSAPRRVNDDPGTNTQFHPNIAVDNNADGCVVFSWRDARNDPANRRVDYFTATTADGGTTISANSSVTDVPSDDSSSTSVNNFLEYDGVDIAEGIAYYAWADNRNNLNGNHEVFFDSLVTECGTVQDDAAEPNETSDEPTDRGLMQVAARDVFAGVNINRHTNGLPDYDWYRYRIIEDGRVNVSIGPSANNLELHVFTVDPNGTLIELAQDSVGFAATRTVSTVMRKGQQLLVEVKGRPLRLGRFGQGSYTLDVSMVKT